MPSTYTISRFAPRHDGTGRDQAGEVARVGGVDNNALPAPRERTHVRELFDRGRQCELLATEPADEAAAAHEAAVFESPQRALHVAPREPNRLLHGEVAEHHAPPLQQQLGDCFGELVAVDPFVGRGNE